jgi:DNA-binding transcriptional LysR family regulator
METEKCKALLKTIECGSFSAAAVELGYTPAGISYMVDCIEQELGVTLLSRNRSGVSLTSNGSQLLPTLQKLVSTENLLKQQSYELRNHFIGEIRIGVYSSIASQLMPQVIDVFHRNYPDVSIRMFEGTQEELENLLFTNQVEFCLCTRPDQSSCQWIPLRKDPMIAALPPQHPLAKQSAIRPEQLTGEPLIMPGNGRSPDSMEVLQKFSVKPNIKYSTIEHNSAFSLVEQGLGICITNELITQGRIKSAVLRPFDPPQHIIEGIVIRSMADASLIAKHLIGYIKRLLKEKGIDSL